MARSIDAGARIHAADDPSRALDPPNSACMMDFTPGAGRGSVLGDALQRDASPFVQSSTEIPGTRLNSSVFAVTTIRPRERACPAII